MAHGAHTITHDTQNILSSQKTTDNTNVNMDKNWHR